MKLRQQAVNQVTMKEPVEGCFQWQLGKHPNILVSKTADVIGVAETGEEQCWGYWWSLTARFSADSHHSFLSERHDESYKTSLMKICWHVNQPVLSWHFFFLLALFCINLFIIITRLIYDIVFTLFPMTTSLSHSSSMYIRWRSGGNLRPNLRLWIRRRRWNISQADLHSFLGITYDDGTTSLLPHLVPPPFFFIELQTRQAVKKVGSLRRWDTLKYMRVRSGNQAGTTCRPWTTFLRKRWTDWEVPRWCWFCGTFVLFPLPLSLAHYLKHHGPCSYWSVNLYALLTFTVDELGKAWAMKSSTSVLQPI